MERSEETRALDSHGSIRLVVQADDFGMCHAVNEGIVRAFREGILTQATMMAPCPWFPEAVTLAHEHRIPVGLHTTLTCEWPHMRWRPLTSGPSLVRHDGTFHEEVLPARRRVSARDALAELEAQAQAMEDAGLPPLYFDAHMGLVSTEAIAALCEAFDKPFILPVVPRFLWMNSFLVLSPIPSDQKRKVLIDHLSRLPPGDHFIQAHPAVPAPELRALATPGSDLARWTEPIRTLDLELLVDPEIMRIVRARGIELTTVASFHSATPEDLRRPEPSTPSSGKAAATLGDAA